MSMISFIYKFNCPKIESPAINAVRDESDLCLRQGNRKKYKKSWEVSKINFNL